MSKASFKANEILPRVPATLTSAPASGESAGDRILLTLLALGFMLLAFFVVLTSLGSFDGRRIKSVVESVQLTFERSQIRSDDVVDARVAAESERVAVNALRASVADIFANVVATDASLLPTADANQNRVEIDVPLALFFPSEDAAISALPLLDKIIAVTSTPPAGYRTELAARVRTVQADMPRAQTRAAVLADTLVQRGLAPTMLSVGTLRDASPDATASLRFSFFLLGDADDLPAARLVSAP